MNTTVIPFTHALDQQNAIIISNGAHRAAVAAEHTKRDVKEIERLPFDLPEFEDEGLFVNVDATGLGILDRRLDWQSLGVELPEGGSQLFCVNGLLMV